MNEEDSQPIECRAAVAISATATNEITFLPAGVHAIRPVSGGIGRPIKVLIDAKAAGEIERQRSEIQARTDKRVYFDFNHEDGRASFWPHSFIWRTSEGVIAKGEWSASGRKAVEGKDFRAFSPVFHVDDKRKDPAKVVCCQEASPNMGGLVNDPAFSNLPLWAKNDGLPVTPLEQPANNQQLEKPKMTTEEIAALQAKKEELETKVENLTAIVAQNAEDEPAKMKLTAAQAEAKAATLEIETAELKAKGAQQAEIIYKHNREVADSAIKAAVHRGAILPKDVISQEKWRVQITADPATFKPMLDNIPGNGKTIGGRIVPTGIVSGSGVSITNEDPFNVYTQFARVVSNSIHAKSQEDRLNCSNEFSALYAGTFKETPKNAEQRSRLLATRKTLVEDAIMAADVTDTNLGTIAGTLVTQRTLELLKSIFPPLVRFTTDFSDQPATFNQNIITRIITVPTVVTYSTATGWADASAQTTDVTITINNHKGIPITFGENLLASTMRQLFGEFAEASAYALAKDLVDSIYSRLTDANFTNNTVSTSAAFNRSAVIDVGVALSTRGVPLGLGNRTMLLWPVAFGNLEKDTSMVQFGTNVPMPTIITEGTTPESAFAIKVESFNIYSAPNLPSNNANLVGFAGSKSALCIATRTPNDYTTANPGSSFGNVQMVTDPDIGITVMQVQYVNHTLGTATSRIALMYGTAAGQTAAGQLIKAAAGTGSAR
jgi:phage I-like protein